MKILILQRHAQAENAGASDLRRPLSPTGLSQAAMQGEKFQQEQITPELILHSSAMRARQTAVIISGKLELPQECTIEDANLYTFNFFELMDQIRALPDAFDHILIVGHNPAIENAAYALSGGQLPPFNTSEAAFFRFDTASWQNISPECCREHKFFKQPL